MGKGALVWQTSVGDVQISRADMSALRARNQARVAPLESYDSYLSNGAILVQIRSSFGELWPDESEIRECLADNCAAIVKLVKKALEQTPPELAADIVEKGIFLAGGGSMLPGLDKLLSEEVNLKVMHADDPLSCVALGTLKVLAELDLLAQIELNN